MTELGRSAAVVIGRNEGAKLRRCLESVAGRFEPLVYVDSESSDGSRELANALGADVVCLDLSTPFTFGRARNLGARRVLQLAPGTAYIQFVDADSEVAAGWHDQAVQALAARPRLGAVWGMVRERNIDTSPFNRLYSLEFDARLSPTDSFGGMAMLRREALDAVDGYNESLATFEDHELSSRLRANGWQLQRLDGEMVIHEAGMSTLSGWWQREIRAGRGRARQVVLHGCTADRGWWRAYASALLWGLVLPALVLLTVIPTRGLSLVLLGGYAALGLRIYRRLLRLGFAPADARLYAVGRVVGKFPQVQGLLSYHRRSGG